MSGGAQPVAHRQHAELRDELHEWLEANWNPELSVDAWWKTVAAAGWSVPHFPVDRWGRGLSIRPLRENDVVCDERDLIGGAGNGWTVTQTTLHFERTGIGAGGAHANFPYPGPKGGMLGRRAGDAAGDRAPNAKLTMTFADVFRLAQQQERTTDPMLRQELARLYISSEIGKWNALRAKAEAQRGGGQAVAGIGKITQTRIVKLAAKVGIDILEPHGLLTGTDGVDGGAYSNALVFSPASSIYGGTDEIQRNIVAERSLGLPREPAPDRDLAYGEVLRGRAGTAPPSGRHETSR